MLFTTKEPFPESVMNCRTLVRTAFIEKLYLWPPNLPHGQLTSLVELILEIARLNHTPSPGAEFGTVDQHQNTPGHVRYLG